MVENFHASQRSDSSNLHEQSFFDVLGSSFSASVNNMGYSMVQLARETTHNKDILPEMKLATVKQETIGTPQWIAQQIGSGAAFAGPMLAGALLTHGRAFNIAGSVSLDKSLVSSAVTGAVTGFALTPAVDGKGNDLTGKAFWTDKAKQTASMSAAFATMAGVEHMGLVKSLMPAPLLPGSTSLGHTILQRAASNAVAGYAGGMVHTELYSGFKTSLKDAHNESIHWAAAGGFMGGISEAARPGNLKTAMHKVNEITDATAAAITPAPAMKPAFAGAGSESGNFMAARRMTGGGWMEVNGAKPGATGRTSKGFGAAKEPTGITEAPDAPAKPSPAPIEALPPAKPSPAPIEASPPAKPSPAPIEALPPAISDKTPIISGNSQRRQEPLAISAAAEPKGLLPTSVGRQGGDLVTTQTHIEPGPDKLLVTQPTPINKEGSRGTNRIQEIPTIEEVKAHATMLAETGKQLYSDAVGISKQKLAEAKQALNTQLETDIATTINTAAPRWEKAVGTLSEGSLAAIQNTEVLGNRFLTQNADGVQRFATNHREHNLRLDSENGNVSEYISGKIAGIKGALENGAGVWQQKSQDLSNRARGLVRDSEEAINTGMSNWDDVVTRGRRIDHGVRRLLGVGDDSVWSRTVEGRVESDRAANSFFKAQVAPVKDFASNLVDRLKSNDDAARAKLTNAAGGALDAIDQLVTEGTRRDQSARKWLSDLIENGAERDARYREYAKAWFGQKLNQVRGLVESGVQQDKGMRNKATQIADDLMAETKGARPVNENIDALTRAGVQILENNRAKVEPVVAEIGPAAQRAFVRGQRHLSELLSDIRRGSIVDAPQRADGMLALPPASGIEIGVPAPRAFSPLEASRPGSQFEQLFDRVKLNDKAPDGRSPRGLNDQHNDTRLLAQPTLGSVEQPYNAFLEDQQRLTRIQEHLPKALPGAVPGETVAADLAGSLTRKQLLQLLKANEINPGKGYVSHAALVDLVNERNVPIPAEMLTNKTAMAVNSDAVDLNQKLGVKELRSMLSDNGLKPGKLRKAELVAAMKELISNEQPGAPVTENGIALSAQRRKQILDS